MAMISSTQSKCFREKNISPTAARAALGVKHKAGAHGCPPTTQEALVQIGWTLPPEHFV